MKDLGFPLDRIAQALKDGVTAAALRGMLMLREAGMGMPLDPESAGFHRGSRLS